MLRDVAQQPLAHSTKTVEGKTGSGSLVDSSVCDEYATRQMWGQNSISPSSRRIPQSRYSDNLLSQQRGFSIAGMSQSNTSMSTDTAMSHAPRPPAVNLNSTVPAQAKPSFGSAFQAGMSGRSNESAPFHVYTKFDRPPNDPNANSMSKKSDSPIGSWEHVSTTPSPSDERRPQCPIQYNNGRTASFPISSNGSDPPSRHTDQKPVWASLQYSRTSQRETPDTSRTSSISSARNQAYNAHLQANSESISMQLGNFSFGAEGRTGTYGRRSLAETSAESALVPDAVPYYRNDASRSGSIAEVPGPSRNHLILDEYNFPQQANGYGPRPSSSYAGRFLQSGCALEFRPGQPYQGNPINSRSYALPGAAMSDFSNYMSGSSPSSRRSPRLAEQQPCIDPRIQHFMDAQFRNAYSNVYNPYAVQNNLQLNAPPPYLGMLPINMTMNGNGFSNSLVRESAAGEGVQSALMYEFKSNTKSKRYELHEIYDHIAEFSGDQHGSRFIQTKLETANSDEKERVFREIQPNAIPLMTDVFGNYVIQKFFEHGDQTHKKILANKMRGHVLQLSLQMYGCRVVQKALDHVLVDQQAVLIGELEKHVTKCVKDQNGNHVVQKAIERCPPATIGFIIAAFRGQVQQLSIHAYGCRVIQRCLEKCDLPSKAMIMSELLDAIPTMIFDQFGNYVVQHMVVYDDGEGRRRVLRTVGASLENYSKHKFASNVVEKCLERADDAWRHNVVLMLGRAQQAPRRIDMPRESEGSLVNLIKDNFGNYVIRKSLSCFVLPILTTLQKSFSTR